MKFIPTLIDDAYAQFKRLWVIRVLLATMLVNGLLAAMSSLEGSVSPVTVLLVNTLLNMLAALLRMAKQPDIENADGTTTVVTK